MAEQTPPRDAPGSTKFDGSRSIRSLRRRSTPNVEDLHPGLIPGINVEKTRSEYPTNYPVFGVALSAIFLGEDVFAWKNGVALLLVCWGIWLVTAEKRPLLNAAVHAQPPPRAV